MPHGLIFERFLNPERVSMPDIDIDFDERRRGDVIRYVTEKWGEDKVAQIATFGTIKAKAAIKDAARVLGYPYALGDRITKAMPPAVMGKDIPLVRHLRHRSTRATPRPARSATLYEADPDVKKVDRHRQGHRGPDPADRRARRRRDHVRRADHRPHPADAPRRRRRDHHAVRLPDLRDARPAEDGLPGPAQPDDHRRRGQEHRAQPRHASSTCWTCRWTTSRPTSCWPAATPWACSSSTAAPMRSLLRLMKPDNFEDISAVLALYRPGPMGANSHTNYALRKNGQQEITPIHPELEEPLRGDPRRPPTA